MPSTTPDQSENPSSRRSGSPHKSSRPPLALAAGVAATWAALVSFVPVAAVLTLPQMTAEGVSLGGVLRISLAGWLLGHGVLLETGIGPLGLPPLALAVLAAWRVIRAGVHASRAIGARHRGSPGQAFAVAGAVGIAYGLLGVLAALIVDTRGMEVSPVSAGLTLTLFGGAAALVGAVKTTNALEVLARRTPTILRDGIRAGVVAALLLLGAGAGVAGLAVATGGGEASEMISAYRTGVTGQMGITLISAAYAPNAAIWSAAYLLGPGFMVGADSVVRTTEVTLGPLPAVPLLAGLPYGPLGGFGAVLLTVPIFAGMAAGWLLTRRRVRAAQRRQVGWSSLLSAAAIAGPVAGVVLGFAAWASGGSLGAGRLVEVGPVWWQVAAAATVVIAIGSLIGAAAARAFTSR